MFENDGIRASFDGQTYSRGLAYARSGRVLDVKAAGSKTFTATVKGSATIPYTVTIDSAANGRKERYASYCDCPVGAQCKHAAAALIVLFAGGATDVAPANSDADPDAAVVSGWLERLAAFSALRNQQPNGKELHYLLDFAGRTSRFKLTARAVSLLKNGERSASIAADLASLTYLTDSMVKPIDRTIGRLAVAAGIVDQYSYPNRQTTVSPRLLAVLLDEVVQTRRAHWASLRAPVLTRHDLSAKRLAWVSDAEGRQRPCVEGEPALRLLPSNPTWYADPESGGCGTIDLGVAAEAAAVILGAPPLTPRSARSVQTAWKRAFGTEGPPAPQPDLETVVVERDPIPVLRLRGFSPSPAAVAELAFAYGESTVPLAADVPREFESKEDGRVTLWPRQQKFEAAARATLDEYGLHLVGWPELQYVAHHNSTLRFPGVGEQHWVRFLGDGVPALRASGWRVEIDPSFPYELIDAGEWDAQIEASANHWFEFDLGITVGTQRVSLLPIIVDALHDLGIRSRQQLDALDAETIVYGRVREGAFVALPAQRIAPLLSALVELFDAPLTREGRLALTPAHISSIAQLERATPVRWAAGTRLREFVRALGDEDALAPAALPATFKGTLRHYQERGVAWLQLLARNEFGGVLADDMGLGKTVELLAHVAIEKAALRLKKPVLIVSPTSVSPNLRGAEIARFVPHLRVLALTGPERFERFAGIPRHDVVLTTYALLQRDIDLLAAHQWQIAVLDEAQAIKNPRSKGAQAAARLRARQRLALTGTPMENHLDELWSVFDFAVPGLLGERSAFTRSFRTPIEKRGDTELRRVLAARLRPFLMRRTKERVALELPAKSEIVNRIELDGAQRDLYETIRIAMHQRVRDALRLRGLARSRIVVLDALLKLRQVCCDPRLLKMSAAQGVRESAKLEALLEMVPELIDEGRRILLFSQFTSMLDLIKPALRERAIDFVELRGETRDRVTPVARFQDGEVPLFLISLKAGGTGLNLTAADTVVHYDPWWNPAVERQATDRAHRIGQHKPVFVYKLIAAGTVEERIVEMQQRKAELAAGIFDESALTTLDTAAIERLFSPLSSGR